jgi:hypothetical protein
MLKGFKLLYILMFIGSVCMAQSKFSLNTTIPIKADFFTTDKQGNVYIVKANELSKYTKAGKLLYKYSNKNFGNIDFVDASNLLRLLVFYKNFSQVVFLDNTLTLSADPVSLDRMGFQQTQLICSSYNNGMWLYNQQNLELVRLNQTFEKTQQTGNLSLLLNQNLLPDNLMEFDNKVYLNNPSTGILIFDIYGTYYKTVGVKNVKCFQPIADWVYYMADNKVKAYNLKTLDETEFEMPLAQFKKFRLELDVLVLQTDDSIMIYNHVE